MLVVLGVFLYATAVAGSIHDTAGGGEVEQGIRLLAEKYVGARGGDRTPTAYSATGF
jgi:hypothetical protein